MSRLNDQVILVTGAGGSLGAATAKTLAASGATVILLGKTIARLEKVYDDIVQAGWPQPAIYPLDLAGATEADYCELAATVACELGKLHGVIHLAAEMVYLAPLEQTGVEVWQRLLQVNLTAPFLLTRALLPLLTHSAATVVFTTDSGARTGLAYWGPYGIAKAGLEKLANLFANEHEGQFRVQVFEPGPVASTLRRKAFPAEALDTLKSPETCAASILELFNLDEQ